MTRSSSARCGHLQGWGDAAPLELSTPISAPAMELATTKSWEPGSEAGIVGWGRTSADQPVAPTQLQWAVVFVQGQGYCESNVPGYHPSAQICVIDALDLDSGPCHGDSGGPLIALRPGTKEPIVIGVVAIGPSDCSPAKPSLATRSDLIDGWVNGRIRELAPPPPPAQITEAPPSLPRLTRGAAVSYTRKALQETLRWRFGHRQGLRVRCRSVQSTMQKCRADWYRSPDDYYGDVRVFYALESGRIVWSYRLTVRWVNDWCYFHSSHPRECRIHLIRR